ncbi:MAG TPA: DNA mismatch endonuclease Vsr [Deltaproteobacteria bacterium]|jgi:DNA mismatch endonuclease (patch repair protein)|nr:DNA mismatch endonuclease Vsr [Deltaproteobacteria bacterium]
MDRITISQRSANMRKIRGKDTSPERAVRRLIRALGFGYRLHGKELPGKPDLVLKGRKKVVFIHGCFWHQHPGCRIAHTPKSNLEYWVPKLEKTQMRDRRNLQELEAAGWQALTVWECEVKDISSLQVKFIKFLVPS